MLIFFCLKKGHRVLFFFTKRKRESVEMFLRISNGE